jgi:hypothetical protein
MRNDIAGKLKGISLDAFLQMAQMEQISCTLTVSTKHKTGQLFLKDGKLISAETAGAANLEAAHHIISWDKTVIDIKNSCSKTVDEIKESLMNILMEAMRLRDETKADPTREASEIGNKPPAASPPAPTNKKAVPTMIVEEEDPPKKRTWMYIIIGLVVVLAAGGGTAHFLTASKRTRLAYERLLQDVEMSKTSNEKLNLLQSYILNNPDSPYKAEANQTVDALLARKVELEFKKISKSATELADQGDIDGAMAVYETYIEENGEGRYRAKAEAGIKALRNRIESMDFETMKEEAMAQGPERLWTYQAFLEEYPDSSHRGEILGFMSDMEEEYFIYNQRQIKKNEASENWGECLDLCQQFLTIYPETDHAETLTKLMVGYREKYQAVRAFTQLCSRAGALGADTEAALAVFTDYLKAYPGTPVKEKIEQEINRLEALGENRRLSDAAASMAKKITGTGSRFTVRDDETVLDRKTGLVWCLLDSQTVMEKCISYEEAEAYVDALETGGHDDWRIPTPEELLALLGTAPTFPSDPGQWYWSSKTQKRYFGQWIIDVETVAPETAASTKAEVKESWQCGAVRACRRQ